MKIKQLWSRLTTRETEKRNDGSEPFADNSQNRALIWLGKDRLERQNFYEQWACHETWHVYKQGLPLLLGRDPDDPLLENDEDFKQQYHELRDHLQRCVQRGVSPLIANPGEEPENWQATPLELYRWAIAARISVPEELDALLVYISRTVKPSQYQASADTGIEEQQNETDTQSLAREQVLSAMLALALQALHQCEGRTADQMREHILQNLYASSEGYFNQQEPPLSRAALHDLIDRSLDMTGLIHISG